MKTIKDIAEAAGVSIGTVDRVIHGRGGVSEKSRNKILGIIEEIGYTPNLNASLLASGMKDQTIVCIIPEFSPGDIWELWSNGIRDNHGYAARYGVNVETVFYNQYHIESFEAACEKSLSLNPSAIIIAPMFRVATVRFVHEIVGRGIPYVYIDSKLDDDGYYAYFGMPTYQSGYLGAYLLTARREEKVKEIVNVRISRDKESLSDPTLMRRVGFRDYINEHLPYCIIRDVHVDPKDTDDISRKLDEILYKDGRDQYIIMFNSRIHLIAKYIKEKNIKGCHMVGYDMLSKNIEYVRNGTVESLITQHCDQQISKAIVSLTDHLALNQSIGKKDNFTEMDILNRYNCDYYV